ncbi:MAG: MotA/TolQ/ExbB proton channel family protein [Bacteroidales bacterium]|nr:MotA/TolQ/ExbB proton channel family protein [Bacteroidales bacterium]
MNYISDILFMISTGLLIPVVVLLIFFFLRALLFVINFFAQFQSAAKTSATLSKELDNLTVENFASLQERLPKKSKALAIIYLNKLIDAKGSEAKREKILNEYEIAVSADISTSKTLSKMGPMLGLMGTLIPMGPALVGLSTGDISTMAYNMQVAFATTVVGLFAAAIGFITQQTKQRWYKRNLSSLEFVSQFISENFGK